jgi:hypothetical protein
MGRRVMRIGICGKAREKRPLGRPTSKWEGNIKMNFKKIKWRYMDWIHVS